jgi:hypothetical protein
VKPRGDDTAAVGKHRKAGPAVADPVTSECLALAYTVAADPKAHLGEVKAAFEIIVEHSLISDP